MSKKKGPFNHKSLLVTHVWDVRLTPSLPPLHSELFLHGLRKVLYYLQLWQGEKGDHKHKIIGRSVKPNYHTVLQVFLQMVVALRHKQQTWLLLVLYTSPENVEIWGGSLRNRCVDYFFFAPKNMEATCDLFSSILGLALGFLLWIQFKMSC